MKNFDNDPNLPLYKDGLNKVWKYAQDNPLSPPGGPSPQASTVIGYLLLKGNSTDGNLTELIKKAEVGIPEKLANDFEIYCKQEIDTIWRMMMM